METNPESSSLKKSIIDQLLALRQKTGDQVFIALSMLLQSNAVNTLTFRKNFQGIPLECSEGEDIFLVWEKIRKFIKEVQSHLEKKVIEDEIEKRVHEKVEKIKKDLLEKMRKQFLKKLTEKEIEYQARLEALEHEVKKETKTPKEPPKDAATVTSFEDHLSAMQDPFADPPPPPQASPPSESDPFKKDLMDPASWVTLSEMSDRLSDRESDHPRPLSDLARPKRGSRRGESSRIQSTHFGPGESLYPDLRGQREAFGELYEKFRIFVYDTETIKQPVPPDFPNFFYEEKFNAGGALECFYHPEKALQQVLTYLRTQEWAKNQTNRILLDGLEKGMKTGTTELELLDIGIAFFEKILKG